MAMSKPKKTTGGNTAKSAAAEAKPKFGSAEWNAKYGIGKKVKKAK